MPRKNDEGCTGADDDIFTSDLYLPEGWGKARLRDICGLINGRAFKSSEWSSQGIPIIRIQNLNDVNKEFNYYNFALEDKYLVSNGQLLFAWSGTPETSFGAHIWNRGKAALNQHIFKVVVDPTCISKTFLMHLLNYNTAEYIRSAHGSAGLAHITKSKFESSIIAVPPFAEQNRIAAKIEALFTHLDAFSDLLLKVKVQLKNYQQSLLVRAFEGELTASWRTEHEHDYEPLSKILERTAIEQRPRQNVKGNVIANASVGSTPSEWTWVRLDRLCDKIQDGTHFSPRVQYTTPADGRYLYVTAKNIKESGLDLSHVTYVDRTFHRAIYARCNPEIGDVLLTKDGAKTGVAAINDLEQEFTLLSSVALLKPNKTLISSCYLKHFLNSPTGFRMITGQMTGTAIKRIILQKIKSSFVPLTNLAEQNEIVNQIESHLSIVDRVKTAVEQNLRRTVRLRNSVLQKAFEGKLVQQNPNDEPASVLLERLKASKRRKNSKVAADQKQITQTELPHYAE
jgi:type I restriction enzyme S subunit